MAGYLLEIAQAALVLALAPGVVGLVRWLKARLQNRRGAPPWQPYFELRKLFGKEVVMSHNASWLFRFTPTIVFASTVAVVFLVPFLPAPLATLIQQSSLVAEYHDDRPFSSTNNPGRRTRRARAAVARRARQRAPLSDRARGRA